MTKNNAVIRLCIRLDFWFDVCMRENCVIQ